MTIKTWSSLRPTLQTRDRELLGSLFALDKRSLAVLRIGVALLLLYDSLTGYLGPEGPLAVSGDVTWDILRVALVPPAVMLLIGLKTRIATILCWLMYSYAIRTSFFTPGASVPLESYVLTLSLFWGMFLPLGATASVDSRRGTMSEPRRFLSVAGAGLMIQVFFMYFSSGVTKDLREWVVEQTALFDVLSNPRHGSELGQALTQYPEVLSALSIATVAVEILGPLLLFVPGKGLAFRRTALVAVFILFHVMLALLMEIGLFPYVMMVVWCAFLPPEFWRRWSSDSRPDDVTIEVDHNRWIALVAAAALVIIVASNVTTWAFYPADSGLPGTIQDVARYLTLYQQWTMYSVPSTL